MAQKIILIAVDALNGASVWLVASFFVAGLLHNWLSPDKMQRMLGNRSLTAVARATLSGMLLPVCSCGVIPLGLGLYYSGAYLGPTLAFMTATPILNPVALLLTYGFLGPQLAAIYVVTGLFVSVLIGLLGNILAGTELKAPGVEGDGHAVQLEAADQPGLWKQVIGGLNWGFCEMGTAVSKYVCLGMLLVGLIIAMVPPYFIQQYLGDPGLISLAGVALLGGVMYVCAVGHIPFIAMLVASGAAPGVAITFLMAGAATNIPELLSLYKLIGRRAAALYFVVLTGVAFAAGYLTNRLLLPDFVPFFSFETTKGTVGLANKLIIAAPEPLQYLCSTIIVALGIKAIWPGLRRYLKAGIAA